MATNKMKFRRERKRRTWKVLLTKATATVRLCKEKLAPKSAGVAGAENGYGNRCQVDVTVLFLEYSMVIYRVLIRVIR